MSIDDLNLETQEAVEDIATEEPIQEETDELVENENLDEESEDLEEGKVKEEEGEEEDEDDDDDDESLGLSILLAEDVERSANTSDDGKKILQHRLYSI
jgi:hypothetical protein